jgi:Spy/CpxP family protein refolding chaperone
MGIMYWKKLVAKQNKLLDEQHCKVKEIEDQLHVCQESIADEERKVRECDEMIARWPIVETMVANVTCHVLNTRKELHDIQRTT